ncbi:MAG: sodium:proton antiporter [Bdellovibrionales bacterium]|nr:sodium:proton antiporter [Bdellovibrionales bacterium]
MTGLATVLFLGIVAQWIAWRFHLPSIILLLLFGFVAGPVTGFIDPDQLVGEMLPSLVSLSVALILFEGGLSLRLRELPGVRRVIFSLISIGMLVTWAIGAFAAHYILELEFSMSVLLGAILTVSGPTVIVPLLRDIRPKATVSSILKWEGILIDPVGAIVAVLVFEAMILGEFSKAPAHIAEGVIMTIVVGGIAGTVGALLLIFLIKRYLIPDYLQNSVSVALVLLVFVSSHHFQADSGLLSVTVMGIFLANWSSITVRHIVEFKENLQVLLIGILFILLSARMELQNFKEVGFGGLIFLAILIFVARPLAVFCSTVGSGLSWRERAFLSSVAPRGIVAAAVASLFSLGLAQGGFPQAELINTYTFLVIVGAGLVYGLAARPMARLLDVEQVQPQGVLLLGAHAIARKIATKIRDEGFKVVLVDTNWTNVSLAKLEGLPTYYGNILSEHFLDDIDLEGIGRLFALTPNNEANSLAALRFSEHFGRAEVYQLPHDTADQREASDLHPKHLRGRYLFGPDENYRLLEQQIDDGAVLKTINITEEFSFDDIQERYSKLFIPLFLIAESKTFEVVTHDVKLSPRAGQKIVALVQE